MLKNSSKLLSLSVGAFVTCGFVSLAHAYGAPLESRGGFVEESYQDSYKQQPRYNDSVSQQNYAQSDSSVATQQIVTKGTVNQADLVAKLQDMEQSIRELRGQLEVQEHTISQLQNVQRQQYQDIDSRLRSGSSGPSTHNAQAYSSPVPQDESTSMSARFGDDAVPQPQQQSASNNVADEQEYLVADEQKQYQQAYNYLRSKKYSQAIPAMHAYLQQHPKGKFAVNAHYWLGELYLLSGDSSKARDHFDTVVQDFPTSNKVPDAILKLGFIAADEGNYRQAQQQLNKLTKNYPNTPAARLAEQRLQQLAAQGG